MYKGLIIRSRDSKIQPMDTKKDKDTEKVKDKTDINSSSYETIRKLATELDKTMKKQIISKVCYINGRGNRKLFRIHSY